jgi:hypothetical protein
MYRASKTSPDAEITGMVRNTNVYICPVGALALYAWVRFDVEVSC